MAQHEDSPIYQKIKTRLYFGSLFLNILVIVLFLLGGFSAGLRNFCAGFSSHFLIQNGLYIIILGFVLHVLNFPLSFFEGYVLEHKFRLSNQTVKTWLKDDTKKNLLGMAVFLLAVEVIYFFLHIWPDFWWVAFSVFWLLFSLVIAKLTPQVFIPMFFKYTDIADGDLKSGILRLFEETRVKIKDAYSINFSDKSRKANVFICGLGANRRVVLTDTLVEKFSVEEIEAVVAHEIAHYKNGDILRLTVVNSIATFFMFYLTHQAIRSTLGTFGFSRIDDIAFFPVMALVLTFVSFLSLPLMNSYSRRLEEQADRFSLEITRKPDVYVSMMNKLGEMNLSEFKPSRWKEIFFFDHPPLYKRIQLAQGFKG